MEREFTVVDCSEILLRLLLLLLLFRLRLLRLRGSSSAAPVSSIGSTRSIREKRALQHGQVFSVPAQVSMHPQQKRCVHPDMVASCDKEEGQSRQMGQIKSDSDDLSGESRRMRPGGDWSFAITGAIGSRLRRRCSCDSTIRMLASRAAWRVLRRREAGGLLLLLVLLLFRADAERVRRGEVLMFCSVQARLGLAAR
jgi:hypothetical protein